MNRENLPTIKLTFPEPVSGYWDHGTRKSGEFSVDIGGDVDSRFLHPGPGGEVKWGSFGLNFYFYCGAGRSWKEAASIAKRVIARKCRVPGTGVEVVVPQC